MGGVGSRLARALSIARDVAVGLVSLIIIASQYSQIGSEPAFLVTVPMSALLLALCIVDIVLVVANRGRGVMVGIAAVQLLPGFLWLGLFLPIGLIILPLNVLVLVSLRQKSPEELLMHPPVLRTRSYKLVVGTGTLVTLLSLPLPWFSGSGSPVSLFGTYAALASHSNVLPSVSLGPEAVTFALLALVGSPLSVLFGALALRWRKLALLSGLLALVGGGGVAAVLGGVAEYVAYVLALGGVLTLTAFFGFRRTA